MALATYAGMKTLIPLCAQTRNTILPAPQVGPRRAYCSSSVLCCTVMPATGMSASGACPSWGVLRPDSGGALPSWDVLGTVGGGPFPSWDVPGRMRGTASPSSAGHFFGGSLTSDVFTWALRLTPDTTNSTWFSSWPQYPEPYGYFLN